MILILAVFYASLSTLWFLSFLALAINTYSYRSLAGSVHFLLLFIIFLKFSSSFSLSLCLFSPTLLYSLISCSSYTLFSTLQIFFYLLISKGYLVSHNFTTKETALLSIQTILGYICYTVYLIYPYGFIVLILFIIYIQAVIAIESYNTIEFLEREARRLRNIDWAVRTFERLLIKVFYVRFSFLYFSLQIFMILVFRIIEFFDNVFWLAMVFVFEFFILGLQWVFIITFFLRNDENFSLSFLRQFDFDEPRTLLQARLDQPLDPRVTSPVVIVTPANYRVYIGELITTPLIYI